jgi:hypothetical protein
VSTEWGCDGEEGDGDDACEEVDEPMKDELAITTAGWAGNGEECEGDDTCEDWTCDSEERQASSEDVSNTIPNAEGVEIVQLVFKVPVAAAIEMTAVRRAESCTDALSPARLLRRFVGLGATQSSSKHAQWVTAQSLRKTWCSFGLRVI